MFTDASRTTAAAIAIACVFSLTDANAQSATPASAVDQNSNVVGTTPPGFYRGVPAMQDNEPSCAINPLLTRNIVCAWNASGGADDPAGPGDTWIRMSESLDGGETFFNRYVGGSDIDLATSLGQQFAADPVTLCWPGGCGVVFISSTRSATSGGVGGGIYLQLMMDMNTETGFRHYSKSVVDEVFRATGNRFADKPHATYIIDEDNPGVVDVSMVITKANGETQFVERQWPKGRIIVSFALFNESKNDIEIMSTFTDNYGLNWSPPKQVAVTSGRDTGISVSAIGDTVFYGFRRFASGEEGHAMMGVVSDNRGRTIGKPFEVASNVCVFDQDTLPNDRTPTAAAARTNDFPWVSNNGENFIMLYSERRPSSDGGCLTDFEKPTDSRIKAIIGSADGLSWGNPVEIAPYEGHGFQFMPSVDCSLSVCQAIWWDTRFDSQRTRNFLLDDGSPFALRALKAFENNPLFADFNYFESATGPRIQFRRTADVLATKILIQNGKAVATDDPPEVVSRYRLGLVGGELTQLEFNPFHIKSYRDESVPFMGDYSIVTSAKQRLVFDADNPENPPFWEDNSSFDTRNPDKDPVFWAAYVDARNVRGQIFTENPGDSIPNTRTPAATSVAANGAHSPAGDAEQAAATTLTADPVEDGEDVAETCTPVTNPPGAGQTFTALNNRTKDFDIYGALIENRENAWSINPTKTLGTIQRSYTVIAENKSLENVTFRFEIANQPIGFDAVPKVARASWDQLPYFIDDPLFQTVAPDVVELESVGPQSSVSVVVFVVSKEAINPVEIRIFNDANDELVDSIIVNGAVEAGKLLESGNLSEENDFEIHDPIVYNPDQFNPDQYNPDQYNPDQYNPDMYNPDQYNPDQYNPDQYNPDQYNPDQYNPDQFNPDQFNPDQYNPDQYNVALTDSENLDNPEIPDPNLENVPRNPDDTVVKLDITIGIENTGNTATPYIADFAITAADIQQLLADRKIATQLIIWQDKQVDDVQFCAPRTISENQVIAAVNDPDLINLEIATITDNRRGAITFYILPKDTVLATLRFIGSRTAVQQVADRLPDNILAYAVSSQAANTNEVSLNVNQEQVIVRPAQFNFQASDTFTFEAQGPDGAVLPDDFVTATSGGVSIPVSCSPAFGDTVGLDIHNSPAGPTPLSCTATPPGGTPTTLNMFVSVLDRTPPSFDDKPLPDLVVEAESSAGTVVDFEPTATDFNGVDPAVVVTCTPAAGSVFPLSSPGPTTSVNCVAEDESSNSVADTFTVTVQDTSAPVITGLEPEPNFSETKPFELDPDKSTFRLLWGPFDVQDADDAPTVACSVGKLDLTQPLYTFVYDFPVGTTSVTCTATDGGGLSASGTFQVTIVDVTPPEISLTGDNPLTIKSGPGPYVDPGATALDNADGSVYVSIDSSSVDTTTAGTYTVEFSATDSSGNEGTANRTVIVEFEYAGASGIQPRKDLINAGSSNPLFWAWLDEDGNAVDSSADTQILSILNCDTGDVVLRTAGDPGSSGFRFKADNFWQFNWEASVLPGPYCAVVESSRSGQQQFSPPIIVE